MNRITRNLHELSKIKVKDLLPYVKFRLISWYYSRYIRNNREEYNKLIDEDRKKAVDILWQSSYGKKFPWKKPVTLNEKITWLSSMTDTSTWTKLSDKYEVRAYVEEKVGADILTKCYGVWNSADEIDFDSLPNSFAIKCTHDCASTYLVKDKKKSDLEKIKTELHKHMSQKYGYQFCEPHYTKVEPRIIAEELIDFDSTISSSIVDYKFWVFNGKVKCCMLVYDRESEDEGGDYVLDLYSVKPWKQMEGLKPDYDKRYKKGMSEPANLERMVEVAEKLGEGLPQVRVDLYNLNGKIYFGEMTFTSQGGRMSYYTQEFQKEMGDQIKLP